MSLSAANCTKTCLKFWLAFLKFNGTSATLILFPLIVWGGESQLFLLLWPLLADVVVKNNDSRRNAYLMTFKMLILDIR